MTTRPPRRTSTWLASLVAAGSTAALLAWRASRERRQGTERLAAATLEALLNTIDANDEMTGAHVRRTADYALVLADALGLDAAECRQVERVALFHDIGKIHAALFDIVHDDSALSPAERRAIATHPTRGAEVLAPLSSFYPDLPEGVLAHHERWDGKGYPHALRGEAIPLSARIVAIADTFDALTASRRYHRGESARRGAEVIAEGRGTQFDPELVDRFLAPEVFARVERAMADAARREGAERTRQRARTRPPRFGRTPSGGDRRRDAREEKVPEISFRWRRPSGVANAETVTRELREDEDAAERDAR